MSTHEFTAEELELAGRRMQPVPTEVWSAISECVRVAKRHGVTTDEIRGRSRTRHIVLARRALWLALRARGWSYPAIARFTGHDHSSVQYGCSQDNRDKRHEAYKDRLGRSYG